MSKAKKIIKKVDPLMGGDVILDKLGLPSVLGDKNGFLAEPVVPETGSVAAASSTPTAVSEDTQAARDAQRRRQLSAAGLSGNVLTGASGLASATTTGKSLLGS